MTLNRFLAKSKYVSNSTYLNLKLPECTHGWFKEGKICSPGIPMFSRESSIVISHPSIDFFFLSRVCVISISPIFLIVNTPKYTETLIQSYSEDLYIHHWDSIIVFLLLYLLYLYMCKYIWKKFFLIHIHFIEPLINCKDQDIMPQIASSHVLGIADSFKNDNIIITLMKFIIILWSNLVSNLYSDFPKFPSTFL